MFSTYSRRVVLCWKVRGKQHWSPISRIRSSDMASVCPPQQIHSGEPTDETTRRALAHSDVVTRMTRNSDQTGNTTSESHAQRRRAYKNWRNAALWQRGAGQNMHHKVLLQHPHTRTTRQLTRAAPVLYVANLRVHSRAVSS